MKNKTRRFSKSAFSVILALCMLLSCLTVGVIPTGAANVEGESTGARSGYTITGSIDSWARSKTMTVSPGGYYCYYDLGANTGQTTYDLAVVESSSSWTRVISRNNTNAHPSDSYWGSGALENGDDFWFWFETSGDDNFHVQPKKTQSHVYVVCYYPNTELNQYSYAQVCCYTSLPNDTPSYYVKNNFNQSSGNTETFQETALTASDANISLSTTYSGTVTFAKASQNYKFQIVKQLGSSYKSNNAAIKKHFGLNNNTISQAYSEYDLYTENDYCKFASPDLDSTTASFTVTDSDWSNNKVQLNNSYPTVYTVSYTLGSNVSYSSVSGGTKTANGTIKAVSGSNVALTVSYATNFTYDSSNSVLNGAAVSNSNKTFTFSNISANKSITINAKSSLTQLSAPTIKYNNATTTPITMDAAKGSKARITWDSDSDAGSYEVYKGSDKVATVTTNYYDIERGYSYGGTYTVKAVPSNTNLYITSSASNGIKFTFDKVPLSAPTVAQSATDIAKGDTVVFTLTNTNTSYILGTDYNYQHSGENNTTYSDVSNLSWTTDKLNTTGTRTFKFKATAVETDYFSDSSVVEKTVTVYAPAYYLVGDLVDSTNNKWNTSLKDYPVDEFVSANVFKRTVTYATGGTNDKHYFRLNNGTNQYTVTSGTDTNMATHTTSSTAVTASSATTSGSMYVTGQGTYTIYVNQATSGSPKVWVEKTEPQKYTTIVYVNKDSGATNMYVWKDANNAVSPWPGEDITTTEETVNDIPYYKYTFESYWDHFDIVVNKGDGQNQSADLTNIAASNTYYVIWDGGANTAASISTTAPVIQLGYKVQNSNSPSHVDFSNRSVSVTLAANTTYEFWLKSANSHLNDQGNGTMTRANCSGWHFPVNSTNTKIQADLAGTYTFTYTVNNGEIYVSVTYPPEPKYNVTVNQGDHGTVKVNGSNFTTGGTIQVGSLTTASIEAVAASGYHFTGWTTSGGVAAVSGYTTSSNPITISASAQGTITATYAEDSYTLTLQSQNNNYGTITTPSSKTLTVHPITATSLSGVTVTPANGYKFNGWTAGTGVTLTNGSTTNPSSGTIKATQNSTLTAKFTKVSYNLTGVVKLNGTTISESGTTVKFYSDSNCNNLITTAQIGNTVYAKFVSNNYALVDFTLVGTGATRGSTTGNVLPFTMGYSATTVTANVRPQSSVTYYVDMHDNSMSGKTVQVAIVTNMGGGTVVKDGGGNNCSATLTQQGNSTVYAATINTPVTQSDSSYSDIYVRVTYTGKPSSTINVPGTKVATLVSTHEMWLEAENEASTALKVNYDTNATPTVEDGNRRIYLAKPYSWQSDEPAWENIGIYHWGNYNDIGWNAGTKMHYLGNSGSDGYHYYYVDIPKAIDGNKVSNLIFQGWGSNQSAGTYSKAQTGNIENIPDSANFFYLSKVDGAFVGTKSEEDAVIPNYTRYVKSVEMNKTETTAVSVKPTYTGENITYTSGSTSVVTVDGNGNITPVGRGTTTITVKIYGTIGSLVTTEDNDHKDYRTYTVSVTVKDPTQFNGFEIMSLESKTYTVNIPKVSGNQPGYFDMSNVVMTVEGIHGVASSTSSAIITQTSTTSVTGVGTVCTAFTVQYAKANSLFENYGDINIIGKVTTKSIARSGGQRYGHESWEVDGDTEYFTTSRTIANSVETATTNGIPFDDSKTTYSAIFAAYDYVDVTFTFNYWEYKPKKVDAEGNVVADNVDGMIQYPYDSTWAGGEDTSNANFAGSHTLRTVTVENYEVRNKTASNVAASDLVTPALAAIGVKPDNNYYDYSIAAGNISIPEDDRDSEHFTANATVNMTHSVKYYSVYLNGNLVRDNYTYQEYAAPSVNTASDWYAVDDRNSTNTTNAPLLATNVDSYKFRVKGSAKSTNTYLRTATATNPHGNDFLRSEVDFSHYEVTHQGSTPTTMKEYLMQNFYIADFFSPAEVLDPNTSDGHGGHLPYDDAQFVGGGVVYYSMNGVTDNNAGTPFANAVSSGYVNGNTGEANAAAIKEMLKANIEAYRSDDVSSALGEEEAMKIAYGTEIKATKNVEGGFNTGIIYRYLPMNQYKRNGAGEQTVDIELTSSNNIVKWTPSSKVENKWQVTSVNDVNDTASNGQRTVRFVNNQGWDVVCVHYWGGSKASYWPGIKMTVVEGQDNVYEAVIPADSKYVVFSDGGYMPETDANGEYTLTKDVNSNTFRYSNTLQSYQYVYASGNENKATNAGKNMRLYSYYVYSYVAYNQETNVPETRYEIVLSDNYSDASTYWEGPNN